MKHASKQASKINITRWISGEQPAEIKRSCVPKNRRRGLRIGNYFIMMKQKFKPGRNNTPSLRIYKVWQRNGRLQKQQLINSNTVFTKLYKNILLKYTTKTSTFWTRCLQGDLDPCAKTSLTLSVYFPSRSGFPCRTVYNHYAGERITESFNINRFFTYTYIYIYTYTYAHIYMCVFNMEQFNLNTKTDSYTKWCHAFITS
jgi:hypothetical protein